MTAADQLFGDTAWMRACNFTGQHGERCRGRANALHQALRLYARLHHTTCQWLDRETGHRGQFPGGSGGMEL